MRAVHPKADLAPRDIVSRAIVKELASTGGTNVFLDITDRPRDYLQKRFPTIYAECMRRGIDIARDTIPVQPVQHYLHHGIYAYHVGFIKLFAKLDSTPAEEAEKLEQLRAIEHGYKIIVGVTDYRGARIDTPQEYEEFAKRVAPSR